jgi:inhibitor of cysteine peptidase
MKTKIIFLGLVAILTLLAGACSMNSGTPKQTTIAINDNEFAQNKTVSKEITMQKGSTLIIEVPSNPSTGFSWTDPVITQATVVKLEESKYIAPSTNLTGASGTQTWKFTATAKGTTKIESQYSRPWEGGEKGVQIFEITITVQ